MPMRLSIALLVILLLLTPALAADEILVRDVTVIDGTGAPPRSGVDILIRDGRIVEIAPGLETGRDAEVIDGRGRYAIPGLIDAHAHLHFPIVFQLTPEEREEIRRHNPIAFLFNGVTTVLNVSSPTDWIWPRRAAERAGELVSPRIYALGDSFTPVDGWGSRHGGALADAEAARARALEFVRADADGFKVIIEGGLGNSDTHRRMPRDMLAAIVEVATEHRVPLHVHAINLDDYHRAAAIRPRAIQHGLEDPIPDGDPILRVLADHGVIVVPTLSLFQSFVRPPPFAGDGLEDPLLEQSLPTFLVEYMRSEAYMQAENESFVAATAGMDVYAWVREANPHFCDNAGRMHAAGVKLAVGTDAGGTVGYNFQGYNTPWELRLLVECGLSPMDALVAATRNGAEVIGVADELGTLEPGRLADLLLLDANPLDDIDNVRGFDTLIFKGRVHARSDFAYRPPAP